MQVRGLFQKKLQKNALSSGALDGSLSRQGGRLARIAVYDAFGVYPQIIDLRETSVEKFLDLLSSKTYQLSHEKGGGVPYIAIKEVVENLIHAFFQEAVISIFDGGNTIRITDQGPGIRNKDAAFELGFSTADDEMKKIIRGVGSGLPVTREVLAFAGGTVSIEDNLDRGTVVTLRLIPQTSAVSSVTSVAGGRGAPALNLTPRQKKALLLVTELGSAGPSQVAGELRIGLSTAYRDLMALEKEGLIYGDEHGKRALTEAGAKRLKDILNS